MTFMYYMADEFILLLINPFGTLIIMTAILIIEKNIMKNINGSKIKIRRIN